MDSYHICSWYQVGKKCSCTGCPFWKWSYRFVLGPHLPGPIIHESKVPSSQRRPPPIPNITAIPFKLTFSQKEGAAAGNSYYFRVLLWDRHFINDQPLLILQVFCLKGANHSLKVKGALEMPDRDSNPDISLREPSSDAFPRLGAGLRWSREGAERRGHRGL